MDSWREFYLVTSIAQRGVSLPIRWDGREGC
jgi:hypothetical protein